MWSTCLQLSSWQVLSHPCPCLSLTVPLTTSGASPALNEPIIYCSARCPGPVLAEIGRQLLTRVFLPQSVLLQSFYGALLGAAGWVSAGKGG